MDTESRKILIVDDDPNFGLALELLFAQNGYQVETARSAEEALERMESFRPRLLLVEGRLPFRSGFEVCQIVRRRAEWQPVGVMLMTANDRKQESAKALALGADSCITKPFSTRELLDTAHKLLESHR